MESNTHKRTRHFNILLLLVVVAAIAGAVAAWDPLARATRYRDYAVHHWTVGALCDSAADEHLAELGSHVATWVNLDERQAAAWDDVEQAIAAGLGQVRGACDEVPRKADPRPAIDRLATAERLAAAGAAALHGITPAFERFYASLDAAQRDRLDAAFTQGRGSLQR